MGFHITALLHATDQIDSAKQKPAYDHKSFKKCLNKLIASGSQTVMYMKAMEHHADICRLERGKN